MGDEQSLPIPPISAEEVSKHIKISEDFYTAFTNHTRIAMSETEIRIFIGESYPTSTNELIVIENFDIVMSPQHTKLLLGSLIQVINGYEKLFGPIKPPTQIPTGVAIAQFSENIPREGTK